MINPPQNQRQLLEVCEAMSSLQKLQQVIADNRFAIVVKKIQLYEFTSTFDTLVIHTFLMAFRIAVVKT